MEQAAADEQDRLASTTPGPALAAELAQLDLATLPGPQLIEVLQASWRQVSHTYALYLAVLAETARCDPDRPNDTDAVWEWADSEISAALTFSDRRTQVEYDLARHLRRRLPQVWVALSEGRIDVPKARVFADYLHERTDKQITRICDRLLPQAPRWTTGQLAARLLREVQAVDRDYTRRRYERAARDRGVWGYLALDGTAVLAAHGLSPAEAAAASQRLERLAEAIRAAGHPNTEYQLRADLFLRLLDGRYTGYDQDQIIAAMLAEPPTTPDNTDPAGSDPAGAQPAGAQPANTEPAGAESAGAEPACAEPGGAGPACAEPADHHAASDDPGPTVPSQAADGSPGPTTSDPADPAPSATPTAQSSPPDAAGKDDDAPHESTTAAPRPDSSHRPDPAPAATTPAATPAAAANPPTDPPAEIGLTASATHENAAQENAQPAPAATPPALGARYGIEVRIGLATLLGLDDHPAEIPGWGPIPAEDARLLIDRQHGAEWRYAITDHHGYLRRAGLTRHRPPTPGAGAGVGPPCRGGIVEIHIYSGLLTDLARCPDLPPPWAGVITDLHDQYTRRLHSTLGLDDRPHARRPGAGLRRHIQIRDRYCVAPGCRRPARKADLDHTVAYEHGGTTTHDNLEPLCAKHHTMKHLGGWRLEHLCPGHFRWRSPLGRSYLTRGEPIAPDLPEPLDRTPEETPDEQTRPKSNQIMPIFRPPPTTPHPEPPPAEQSAPQPPEKEDDTSDEPPF